MSKSRFKQDNKSSSAASADPQAASADPQMVDPATYDEIAARAYEIFQARGGGHGADLEDWLQAEREVLQRRREQVA